MNIKGCPTWEERAKEEYLWGKISKHTKYDADVIFYE